MEFLLVDLCHTYFQLIQTACVDKSMVTICHTPKFHAWKLTKKKNGNAISSSLIGDVIVIGIIRINICWGSKFICRCYVAYWKEIIRSISSMNLSKQPFEGHFKIWWCMVKMSMNGTTNLTVAKLNSRWFQQFVFKQLSELTWFPTLTCCDSSLREEQQVSWIECPSAETEN